MTRTTQASILQLADALEALTREETLRDIDTARAEWSPAGLRELARMRAKLEHAAERDASKPTVAVLTIEHRHGVNTTVHVDRPAAIRAAAQFVGTYWDEIADDAGDMPDDDAAAVDMYFDSHPSEFMSITETEIEP